jgi:drug/metabolite transporter (DMT)-like permease
MMCERPPRSLRSHLPLTRGRLRLQRDTLFSPSVRGRAAEGGRGSLTRRLRMIRTRTESVQRGASLPTDVQMQPQKPDLTALVQIHLCVVLWGFTAILGKAITLRALPLVWWRMTLVAAALLLLPTFWKGLSKLSPRLIATYLGIGVIVAVHWISFYGSIKLSNASVAATCMALAPVFVAFIEPVLVGRHFDMRELFFGIAVIPGVMLVVGGIPSQMRIGLAVGILSALLAAIFGTLNKRYIQYVGALTVTGLEMAAGVVCLTLLAFALPASDPVLVKPNAHDTVLLVVLAMGCTLLPFALSLVALRQLSAFTTALAVNMEPVYAIFLAIVFLGEQRELYPGFYLGVAIVFIVVFSHARRARSWQNFLNTSKQN